MKALIEILRSAGCQCTDAECSNKWPMQRVEYTTNPIMEATPGKHFRSSKGCIVKDVMFPVTGFGMPIEQIERAAKFRVKIMRELGCLKDWINAVSNPNILMKDPIELKMIDNIFNDGDST